MIFRRVLLTAFGGLCFAGAVETSAMAATSQNDTTQPAADRGSIDLDQRRSQAAPERATSGNPLWAIPLASLSSTRDRPIFTPSRRPPSPPAVIVPERVAPPKVVARPVAPQHSNLKLIGTVVGETEGIGIFLDQATHNFVRLKTGEGHAGWILQSVKTRETTLQKEQNTETMRLPAPGENGSVAPKKDEQL